MKYTIWELVAFLLVYSFLGWIIEVGVMAIKERKFCNRGFLNLPLCLSYGISLDILILIFPTWRGNLLIQALAAMVVTSAVEVLAGFMAKRIWKNTLWKYDYHTIFSGERTGLFYSLLHTAAAMITVYLIQPVAYMIVNLIPKTILMVLCIVLLAVIFLDLLTVLYAARKEKISKNLGDLEKFNRKGKRALGNWICQGVWKRLNKAYPQMEQAVDLEDSGYVFAKGVCFDKLVWVFLICALLGDGIETVFCRITGGVWMSRSSVIYGPFSIVWGIGAVLLTVVLQKLAGKEDRYVFFAGCILGGVYEYLCSVFTEIFLGTTFWDYSKMPFNIGGRTNLLYCVFWGILSVAWVKICYPKISGFIEKLPALGGKIATWILLVLMICNGVISAAAMIRYVERKDGVQTENSVERFLDDKYPDQLVEWVWPNMRIGK